MSAEQKPKRIIDRERQWRKIDAGHYVSPKGRFHATRDEGGWMLLDTEGAFEPEWFARWRDARRRTEDVEFGDAAAPADAPIELVEDEIRDEFHDVYRVKGVRDGETVFDIVVRNGQVFMQSGRPYSVEEAEAYATALMVACHRATQPATKEV